MDGGANIMVNYDSTIFYAFGPVRPDRQQTVSDAYEPTVQIPQVGSKTQWDFKQASVW